MSNMVIVNRLWILWAIICILSCSSFAKDYNIVTYGAVANSKTLNTSAIQSAINAAFTDGGGRVVIPNGKFLTGSLVLKTGVELYLNNRAILLGSTNIADYFAISENKWPALIMADDAGNIAIRGKGIIDGQGAALALYIDSLFYAGKLDSSLYQFKEKRPVAHARPQIIQFVHCFEIQVHDVTIKNSASWVQSYDLCFDVVINGIKVESVAYWNNDGIDIIDCKRVRITDCIINSSDDGICVKSYSRGWAVAPYCDSIYIGNCVVRSSASAIKLGTSSFGGFRNVIIEKIRVFDTFRSAIAIECWETGIVENILIQDITAVNTGNAIFIRLSKRPKYNAFPMGKLRNVVIRNVKVTVPFEQPDYDYEMRGPALPFFHNVFPSSITGIPGFPVENVLLENIKIVYPGRGNQAYANMPISRFDEVPEKIEDYPEFSMFGELPAWGFYVRHVDGLMIRNLKLKIKKPDYRQPIVLDDVKNVVTESIRVIGDQKDAVYRND